MNINVVYNPPLQTWSGEASKRYAETTRAHGQSYFSDRMTSMIEASVKSFFKGYQSYEYTDDGGYLLADTWPEKDSKYPLYLDDPPFHIGKSNQPTWSKVMKDECEAIVMSPVLSMRGFAFVDSYRVSSVEERGSGSGFGIYKNHLISAYGPYLVKRRSQWVEPTESFVRDCENIQHKSLHITDDEWDKLASSALARANSAIYDLATDLAEMRETIDFLTKAVVDVTRALKLLKRKWFELGSRPGDLNRDLKSLSKWIKKKGYFSTRSVPKHLEASAEYWLQYRYAVMPLMFSIRDAIDAYNSANGRMYQRFRERKEFFDSSEEPYGSDFTVEYVTRHTARVYVRQMVDMEKLSRKVSFYIPTAAWEIVPWSFVIDWFINVGDWIQAWSPSDHEIRVVYCSLQSETQVIVKTAGTDSVLEERQRKLALYGSDDYSDWQDYVRSVRHREIPAGQTVYSRTDSSYRRWEYKGTPSIGFTDEALSLFRRIDAVALSFLLLRKFK